MMLAMPSCADSASFQEWGCGALLNRVCGSADGTALLLAAGPAGIDVVLATLPAVSAVVLNADETGGCPDVVDRSTCPSE